MAEKTLKVCDQCGKESFERNPSIDSSPFFPVRIVLNNALHHVGATYGNAVRSKQLANLCSRRCAIDWLSQSDVSLGEF